jgi:hypothetical protein
MLVRSVPEGEVARVIVWSTPFQAGGDCPAKRRVQGGFHSSQWSLETEGLRRSVARETDWEQGNRGRGKSS